jgi:hypothetical protein
VTALVPSETACLANSPGRIRRTLDEKSVLKSHKKRKTYDVWISRDEMVDFLLYAASLDASVATRSKISLTKELRMDMARLEIPVSGWTCFNTKGEQLAKYSKRRVCMRCDSSEPMRKTRRPKRDHTTRKDAVWD